MTVRRTQVESNTYRLGYTRLYREDLEAIAQLLLEVGPLSIICDSLEATEPRDFADPTMPERPRVIRMWASNGKQSVTVELGRSRGRLVIEEPNTLTEGIQSRIEKICEGRFFDVMIAGRLTCICL
jgi:hypothetical protein